MVSHKIDFKAVWSRNGHADSVGVKIDMVMSRSVFNRKFQTYCLLDKELFGSLISSSNNHGDNSNQNSNESQNHTNRNNDINSKKFLIFHVFHCYAISRKNAY